VLTCVSYPTADVVIETHKEGELYWEMVALKVKTIAWGNW
jgi:hypothetical protein